MRLSSDHGYMLLRKIRKDYLLPINIMYFNVYANIRYESLLIRKIIYN